MTTVTKMYYQMEPKSIQQLDWTLLMNCTYVSSKTDHSTSVPSVSGGDITITPNPAYVIDPNPPQTRKKFEQQYDYDYVESDELANKF